MEALLHDQRFSIRAKRRESARSWDLLLTAIHTVRILCLNRSECGVFLFACAFCRLALWMLVGHRMRVGNSSVMNQECLKSLCVSPEMWNHYAAGG